MDIVKTEYEKNEICAYRAGRYVGNPRHQYAVANEDSEPRGGMRQSLDDQLTHDNIHDAALLLNECVSFWKKYESYISRMDFMQKTLFYGMVVDCWNGEQVGVNTWETYFKNIFSALTGEVRRLS